ncbi:S8 family peptidase [Labilibacter sediminis]|nr:S8 family peptidase [Labilibacter sediminis]
MSKPHLRFKNPTEGLESYKPRPGVVNKEKEEPKPPEAYEGLVNTLVNCKEQYQTDASTRHNRRTLDIQVHFDMIELTFFGTFDQPKYESYYSSNFGLVLVHLSEFNRKGLFIIEDEEKFITFFTQIDNFYNWAINVPSTEYDRKIKFIKEFKLFSSLDMKGNIDNYQSIHLSLIEGGFADAKFVDPQKLVFEEYLIENGIDYHVNNKQAELYGIDEDTLNTIIDNFDIIHASCSGSGAIIQPNIYNTPQRDYGFSISNAQDDLPIIGVIDTGVSNQTPLKDILVGNNGDFDTTGTGSFVDNANHGTGVAAFAAFGDRCLPHYHEAIEAEAKILPIKILDSGAGAISQNQTVELIREANRIHGVKLFTLTIGYTDFPLKDNQQFSSYAAMLDKLAAELDILIFISTSNNFIPNLQQGDYPGKYTEQNANIAPPAESMNNITIGAYAENHEDTDYLGLAPSKEFPAIYSRKLHYDFDNKDIFNNATTNKLLRKPDILMPGGDYHEYLFFDEPGYDDAGHRCLNVLSANLEERIHRRLGTSYSAPLAANQAARLLKMYPDINMLSLKALLVNTANDINCGDTFDSFTNAFNRRIMGYGAINGEDVRYSSENKVNILLEDEIYPDHIKSFPIHLPKYLNEAGRINGLLKVKATLCFKFVPKDDNQLLYCPYHVGFAIGRNLDLNKWHSEKKIDKNNKIKDVQVPDGFNGNSSGKICLNSNTGWSQDYYYKGKLTSNVQKVELSIKKEAIINEDNTFKIVVNSAFQKMLSTADKRAYENAIPFSLAISIEQVAKSGEELKSLYDEIQLVNELSALNAIDLEAELES